VLTFAALADAGEVTPRTRIAVPGALWIDGHEVNDNWPHGLLRLTAAGVIAKSSNLGTVLASRRISDELLYDYLRSFGLGEPTGVGLPGESGGILPPPQGWADINHATIAFGQGLSVTVLQMAAAVGAVANGGTYVQPSLVSGFVRPDGTTTPASAPATHQAVSERAAATVTRMMEAVTTEGGTAPLAAIPGYRVAGKTGTAQRVDPETGAYVDGQNTISFAGFAPADAPRFVTYVVLDNPRPGSTGGASAAPVFADVMSMLLQRYGVPPTGTKPPSDRLVW
jgi:cell division protein FtsI (penicillin-binding protein 3)